MQHCTFKTSRVAIPGVSRSHKSWSLLASRNEGVGRQHENTNTNTNAMQSKAGITLTFPFKKQYQFRIQASGPVFGTAFPLRAIYKTWTYSVNLGISQAEVPARTKQQLAWGCLRLLHRPGESPKALNQERSLLLQSPLPGGLKTQAGFNGHDYPQLCQPKNLQE